MLNVAEVNFHNGIKRSLIVGMLVLSQSSLASEVQAQQLLAHQSASDFSQPENQMYAYSQAKLLPTPQFCYREPQSSYEFDKTLHGLNTAYHFHVLGVSLPVSSALNNSENTPACRRFPELAELVHLSAKLFKPVMQSTPSLESASEKSDIHEFLTIIFNSLTPEGEQVAELEAVDLPIPTAAWSFLTSLIVFLGVQRRRKKL